ncbi:MAG: hypothetical protein RL386_1526, partial [Bacteroidota bacterium]
ISSYCVAPFLPSAQYCPYISSGRAVGWERLFYLASLSLILKKTGLLIFQGIPRKKQRRATAPHIEGCPENVPKCPCALLRDKLRLEGHAVKAPLCPSRFKENIFFLKSNINWKKPTTLAERKRPPVYRNGSIACRLRAHNSPRICP